MIRDLFGEPTPTKVLSWVLFALGVLVALGSRMADPASTWLGTGLILIGLSMLVDVLLPGGSELTDEQIKLVRHAGIPQAHRAHKWLSLGLGVPLISIGAWLVFG
jgi:hypothetical protein